MKVILQSLRLYLVFTLLLGLVYPVVVTFAGGAFLKEKAGGSLIQRDGRVIGSRLISQKFENPKYFQPRPSAIDYNPLPSGGSNLGPTSKKLQETVRQAQEKWGGSAPQELLFASGSGLDPHLSIEAVLFQLPSVARARNYDAQKTSQLAQLVRSKVEDRALGIIAEPVINVLELNLAVDQLDKN